MYTCPLGLYNNIEVIIAAFAVEYTIYYDQHHAHVMNLVALILEGGIYM